MFTTAFFTIKPDSSWSVKQFAVEHQISTNELLVLFHVIQLPVG